jgi:bacillopeptidase F (M6 metalloprotease family)
MAAVTHSDYAWNRLARTIDLTGVSAAAAPTFRTQLLWDTEEGYDHAVLEAHTAGADDWTTLPEKGGATSTTVPAECEAGFFIQGHPALTRYLTLGSGACTPTGTSGSWNSFTGASDGWQEVNFDLSAYAGKTVEVSLSYITDPGSGGHGVLADNASVVIGGTAGQTDGFETSLGAWSVAGPPAGSPAVVNDWGLSGELFKTYGAVTTRDTVLLGFGLEHVTAAADRTALLGKALAALRS